MLGLNIKIYLPLSAGMLFCTAIVSCGYLKVSPLQVKHGDKFSQDEATVLPGFYFKPEQPDPAKNICFTSNATVSPLPETRLSDGYLNNCSGCHGTRGEGRDGAPNLRKVSTLELFSKVVRGGGASMPAFTSELITDDELAKDFSLLSADGEIPVLDSQSTPVRRGSEFTEESYLVAMRAGLVAWRQSGERGSCSSCHGPDGIDLATFDYSNSAMLRRALGQGLPSEKSKAIVRMIDAQRWRYGISTFCKSKSFIPFQPGGIQLGGSNGFERDKLFSENLRSFEINLSLKPDDLAATTTIVKAIANLDVKSVPIAISFNRWTEDGFHGETHRSTAEWLPEIPMEAGLEQGKNSAWVELQNRYIGQPIDENFWNLYDGVSALNGTRFTAGGVSERIAREKYRSVLLFQHMLRTGKISTPDLAKAKDTSRFPIWETAQISEVMSRGCADVGADSEPYPCWKYPGSFYKKMGTDRAGLLKDIQKIRAPWLLAGWTLDPSLQFTEEGDAQIIHLHEAIEKQFDRESVQGGVYNHLPLHNIYFSFVRLIKAIETSDKRFKAHSHLDKLADSTCWNQVSDGLGQWTDSTLTHIDRLLDSTRTPLIDPEHKTLVLDAVATVHRVILFKIRDHAVGKPDICKRSEGTTQPIKDVLTKIAQWHSQNQQVDAKISTLIDEIGKAF